MKGLPDSTKAFLIQKLLTALSRPKSCDVRLPISKPILQDFITSLQHTNSSAAERILFVAMFLTAFYGFFRIGEFAAKSASSCTVILYDNVSAPSHPPVKFIPWMKITITHSKHKTRNRPFDIIITGNDSSPFCHSFLIGAACHAADKGFFNAQIRALGRWKSDAFKLFIRISTLQAIKFVRVSQGLPPTQTFLGIRQAFLPRDELLRTSALEANSVAAIVLFGRLIKFCPYRLYKLVWVSHGLSSLAVD